MFIYLPTNGSDMGSEFIGGMLVWKKEAKLNWHLSKRELKKAIDALIESRGDSHDQETVADRRERIEEDIEILKNATVEYTSTSDVFRGNRYNYLVAGSESWGDCDDVTQAINDIYIANIATLLGFEKEFP